MNLFNDWHPRSPVNLQTCKDEPIHVPGAIQPFGLLVAFDGRGFVKAASANAVESLPKLAAMVDGPANIQTLIKLDGGSTWEAELSGLTKLAGRKLLRVIVVSPVGERHLPAVLYASDDLGVLEVEFDEHSQTHSYGRSYLANLQQVLRDLQGCGSVEQLAAFSATTIKKITGFDRVMVYRYDENWNGEVIAEAKEDRLEPFLGLHYPASDIPVQARKLYERNWIRIIPTIHYRPIPLVPKDRQNLDLSNSLLRSVSPIHIQYLKNMGVGASMSISLMVDGKLWGLVACHHYGNLYVPLEVRLGCEALGQLISWQIQVAQSSERYRRIAEGEAAMTHVLQLFSEAKDFQAAAQSVKRDLLEMFDCTGIVLRLGQDTMKIGEVPSDATINAINGVLTDGNIFEPFASSEMQTVEYLRDLPGDPKACGLMALPLAPRHNYFIACFRPELVQTVNWAGNPHTKDQPFQSDNPDQRLQPRGSFALWQELNRGRSQAWTEHSRDLLKRFALLFMKIVIERKEIAEKAAQELEQLSRAKDEFVAIVSHELRTPLNAIIGWTELALSGDIGDNKQTDVYKIIQRNARSQNQLIGDLLDISRILSGKMKLSVKNMRVSEIVESVVLSFEPAARAKSIDIITSLDNQSDSIIGDPARMQQVIWNLLSNAVKFSSKQSKIWISVKRDNSQILLQIRDQGVGIETQLLEKIFDRFQQADSSVSRRAGGLGLGLSIARHIVELHGGRLIAQSAGLGRGSVFTATFPISPLTPEHGIDPLPIDDQYRATPSGVTAQRLAGEIILIVEDEPDALLFLQALVTSHGAKIYTARNGVEAQRLLNEHKADIGIVLSDIGMPEMDGYALVESIRASPDRQISSVCAVALTAFSRPQDRILALKAGFDSYISKPVMQEELLTVLESACKAKKR